MRLRRPPFRRFAAFTTGLTLLLVMLGIYTASGGFGGGCGAFWLTCNGNLLPRTYPAFVEWLHRLVAMVAGWFILGTALWAWLGDQSRATAASAVLGAALLPVQVALGAVTLQVYSRGAGLPLVSASQWATLIFAAHYVTAVSIFALLVATTAFAYRGHYRTAPRTRVRRTLVASLAALPLDAALSRVVAAVPYSEVVQPVFFGLSLAVVGAVLAAALWTDSAGIRAALAAALALLFGHLLLGAGVVTYTAAVRVLNAALLLGAGALVAAATWLSYRDDPAGDAGVAGTARGD